MVKKLAKSLVGAALAGLCFVSVAEPSDKAKPEQPNQPESKLASQLKSELANQIYCSNLLKSIHEGEPVPSELFLQAADLPKWCFDSVIALGDSRKKK